MIRQLHLTVYDALSLKLAISLTVAHRCPISLVVAVAHVCRVGILSCPGGFDVDESV